MSTWFKSGLGWSENRASSIPSNKASTIATPSTAAQTTSVSESPMSSMPMHATEAANSKPLEAAKDTRATENGGTEDDAPRPQKREAEAPHDPSEAMHQQLHSIREQVATISSKTISIRGEIKDLYRITNQEESERRAGVEAVQAALKVFEERIFAILEDFSRNQVSGMSMEMERAQRRLEREATERIKADRELANAEDAMKTELQALRNELEQELAERGKGDENCLDIMKEELDKARTEREDITLLAETLAKTLSQDFQLLLEDRIGQTEALVRNLLKDEEKVRAAGDVELGSKIHSELERMAADLEREADARTEADKELRKELERQTTERIKVDRELGNAEEVLKTELQALRNELKQECAERVKGDENCFDTLKLGLEQELAERVKADERCLDALTQGLDKARTEREDIKLSTEALVKTLSTQTEALTRNLLEDEAKARAADDVELGRKMQSELEKCINQLEALVRTLLEVETKARAAGDVELGSKMQSELEKRINQMEALTHNLLEVEAKARAAGNVELDSKMQSELERMAADLEREAAARIGAHKEVKKELERETTERIKVDSREVDAFMQGLDNARSECEEIKLSTEALVKTLSQDYILLLEKRISQTEALTRNLLEDEAKARAAGDVELDSKVQSELERMAADLEREAHARTEGDKDTVKEQFVETALKQITSVTTDLQKQLEQEMTVRIAEDEQIGKLLTEGFVKAGSERSLMVESIEAKIVESAGVVEKSIRETTADLQQQLEQEARLRGEGDRDLGKILTDWIEEASRRESEMIRMADSIEGKIMQMCRSMLEDEVKVRELGDEELRKNLQDGLEKAGSERSEVARMVESLCEKLKDNLSELESRVNANESNLSATVVDLTALSDGLTSTVQAEAGHRAEMESKVEQSCKELRAEIDQAFNESVASLKVEISDLNGKHDALDTVASEIRIEVEEHKQGTEKQWPLIHKRIQDIQAQYEEWREAHQAAHSRLQVDTAALLAAASQTTKSEITQLKLDQDLVMHKLQDDYDTLQRRQEGASVAWQDEVRRVWEAMDSHTHNVNVTEYEKRNEPTKAVIKREIVREVTHKQIFQPPIVSSGYKTVPSPSYRNPLSSSTKSLATHQLSSSTKSLTNTTNTVAVRVTPRAGSPSTTQGGPSSVRPPTKTIPPSPVSHSPVSHSPVTSQRVMIRPATVEPPNVVIQPDSPMRSSRHSIPSLSSTPGKIHHHLEAMVGKAVFEHKSDLDPETRREQL